MPRGEGQTSQRIREIRVAPPIVPNPQKSATDACQVKRVCQPSGD
jgi:hypothetical protein